MNFKFIVQHFVILIQSNKCIECGMKNLYYMCKSKHCSIINLISSHLFFITFHFFKNDTGSIEAEKNFNCLKCNDC